MSMTRLELEAVKFRNEVKFLLVDLLVHLQWEDRTRVEKFLKEHYLEFSPHMGKLIAFQRDRSFEKKQEKS